MKRYFRTIQSVLDSRWGNFQYAGIPAAQKTDRVLQSSKLEDCIYHDLSRDDENLEAIQQEAAPKLHSFPALSRDIFQSFYSLFPKRTDTDSLTAEAQKFNAKLLDHVTEDADYPTIKSICEGRELPAYEAASEFTAKISAQLDDLLPELGGEDGTLKTLEKLQAARNQAQQKLTELLEQMRDSVQNPTLEQAVIDAANQAESKTQQAEAVAKMVDTTARQNKAAISESVSAAVEECLGGIELILYRILSGQKNVHLARERTGKMNEREFAPIFCCNIQQRQRHSLTPRSSVSARGAGFIEAADDVTHALVNRFAPAVLLEPSLLILLHKQRKRLRQSKHGEL